MFSSRSVNCYLNVTVSLFIALPFKKAQEIIYRRFSRAYALELSCERGHVESLP